MNWLWGFNESVSITLETFRTILMLMDEYPDFIFSQSQGCCYEIVERFDPMLCEAIKRKIAEGRWEVTAATWSENDKNLPNAESIARHYLYTQKYLTETYGIKPGAVKIDFQPDTFGHNAFTPELASKAGIEYYYHCRGREPKPNLYKWRSASGAEILVYQDPLWYNTDHCRHLRNYDFLREVPVFCKENNVDTGLFVYGVGNHGGGPTRRILESLMELRDFPLGPTVKFAAFHEFYESVKPFEDKFPVHEGELNFIFTGCYSSQSVIKMANRFAENKLYVAETLSALSYAYADGFNYGERYEKAWKDVLFNQFHDILPGSCNNFAQNHAVGLFQECMGYTVAGSSMALNELASVIDTSSIEAPILPNSDSEGAGVGFNKQHSNRFNITPAGRNAGKTRIYHVFNPCSFSRSEVIELVVWDYDGDSKRLVVKDTDANELPQTLSETDELYWNHSYSKLLTYVKVPAFGYITLIVNERKINDFEPIILPDPRLQEMPENILENDLLRAVFDESMNLVSLIDKKNGTERISGKAGYLKLSEHNTAIAHFAEHGDSWKEGAVMRSRSLNDTERVMITKRTSGIRQSISYTMYFLNSKVDVTVSLDYDSSVVRYFMQAEWADFFTEDKNGLPTLKFIVPIAFEPKEYWYQNQLGVSKRGDLRFDAPGRDFVFAPDGSGRGVAVLSDYLYGYHCEKGVMSVTMLRASQHPDRYPEVGFRCFDIGIGVLSDDLLEMHQTASCMTEELPYITNKSHDGSLPLNGCFMKVEGNIVAGAVKSPQDNSKGFVIRLYEVSGQSGKAALSFTIPPKNVTLTDIHEKPVTCGILSDNRLSFDINANEVVTLKVTTA
jgi:alpha-mannosidase